MLLGVFYNPIPHIGALAGQRQRAVLYCEVLTELGFANSSFAGPVPVNGAFIWFLLNDLKYVLFPSIRRVDEFQRARQL